MTRTLLCQMLSERRAFKPGSLDWQWRTDAARKLAWVARGKPVDEWPE